MCNVCGVFLHTRIRLIDHFSKKNRRLGGPNKCILTLEAHGFPLSQSLVGELVVEDRIVETSLRHRGLRRRTAELRCKPGIGPSIECS